MMGLEDLDDELLVPFARCSECQRWMDAYAVGDPQSLTCTTCVERWAK